MRIAQKTGEKNGVHLCFASQVRLQLGIKKIVYFLSFALFALTLQP